MAFHPPLPVRRLSCAASLIAAALLALSAAPAGAVTFGPDLSTATADYQYTCGIAWAWQGCTVQDPMADDMELVLPDPVVNGNQTGVVTAIHVKSAATAPAQFVVVEWSGKPNEGSPFPSGVMAVSQTVTLQPGVNHFNTNLPVDRRLASNGFASWSVVSLNILDATSPIPAQSGGLFATTGILLDNGAPLTQTTADLTVAPHNVAVGGLPPARLLMSGEVTITTPQAGGTANTDPAGGGTTNTDPAAGDAANGDTNPGDGGVNPAPPQLAIPASAHLKGATATLRLRCAGAAAAACTGIVRIQSRAATATASSSTNRPKPVTYATGSFSIPGGTTRPVKMKLSKAGRKASRRHRSLRAYANTTFRDGRITTARIMLKR